MASTAAAEETSAVDWADINKRLRAAFPPEKIKDYNAGKAGKLSYLEARDVMDLLDDVVGPGNWEDDYEIWDPQACAVKCTVWIHGRRRSDVGYPNNPVGASSASDEPYKDACTDAFKRAMVHWGTGRFLYQEGHKGQSTGQSETRPTGNKTASDKQIEFIKQLAGKVKVPVNLNGLSASDASALIEGLRTQGANFQHPRLTGEHGTSPGPVQPPTEPVNPDPNTRMASANQLATIEKLQKLLGDKTPIVGLTSSKAADVITDLARKYNEGRQSVVQS